MESERESFREMMGRIGKGLDTHTVFGEPEQVDGAAIIPVARISYGGGGGRGEGRPGEENAGEGEGMGMGFGVAAKPMGVVRVTHDGVEWIPTVDRNALVLLWSIVGGLLLIMTARRVFSR